MQIYQKMKFRNILYIPNLYNFVIQFRDYPVSLEKRITQEIYVIFYIFD